MLSKDWDIILHRNIFVS